ncbi:hypothetical protein [Lactococcus lactis]|jgi:predicted transcriptional regulator|uniref:Uncharacterized protein n=2 Tax=Lactococcus lactis TaxID=1358 RepID=A0AAP8JCY4_9LACT|nr:hypothetical protein [Lactococcus lactis]AIS04547.1 hypothetical protein LG36_1952 [Lactococcus lactis]KSU12873.1 hypothetical protein LMG8526_0258 [Lactococcus lactis subsp. lactis]MCQ4971837.1 hypothetical protein [Lactococcus lactis]MCQ4997595.1 hypothetical protein [Lactococcus lactis]MCT3131949.1 hypothetical protein [Lactococcus lactis]
MIELFKDLKNIIGELSEEVNTMKIRVDRVQEESIKAAQVGKDIQKKVDEFQISIQPRVEKINELINQINKRVE